MSSTGDRIKGVTNKLVGAVKRGIGRVTGSTRLQAEGAAQQGKGSMQEASGKVKDGIKRGVDRV